MSQLIKVLHKLCNSDSLFLNFSSYSSQKILKILRHLTSNRSIIWSWLMLIVCKAIGISLRDQFSIFVISVYILNKLIVVDLVEISSVHILFKKQIKLFIVFWYKLKLFQNSCKLIFCHITDFCDIKILK